MMKQLIRLTFVAIAAAALASALAIAVRAEPTNHANRLEVTFTETPASITNRVADLGVFQLILTANGTLDGFGAVSEIVGVTQDRAVHPCGDGSDSESDTRRIVASDGTLALRETGIKCPTPSGLVFTGTYQVDGLSSTGVFAGARGSGDVTIDIAHTLRPCPGGSSSRAPMTSPRLRTQGAGRARMRFLFTKRLRRITSLALAVAGLAALLVAGAQPPSDSRRRHLMTHLRRARRRTLIATLATALTVGALTVASAGTAAQQTEHIYAGGNTYTINTEAAVDVDASAGVLAQSAPFYIIGFPVAAGTTGPITLPVRLPAPEQRASRTPPLPRPHRGRRQQSAPARRRAPIQLGLRLQPHIRPTHEHRPTARGRSQRQARHRRTRRVRPVSALDEHRPRSPSRSLSSR